MAIIPTWVPNQGKSTGTETILGSTSLEHRLTKDSFIRRDFLFPTMPFVLFCLHLPYIDLGIKRLGPLIAHGYLYI
jgi:hypothetical protein